MPQFAVRFDDELEKMIASLGNKIDEVAPIMLSETEPILKKEAQARAVRSDEKHKHFSDNIGYTKPKKTKDGAWIANVTIKGTREDGVRLMEVAAINEYGTSKQSPQPFLKPAIASAENQINEKMKEIFQREMSK